MRPERRRIKVGWIVVAVLLAVAGGIIAMRSGLALPWTRRPEAPRIATRPIRIEVLNGCGVPGVAEKVASRLRAGRFVVERTGDAPEFGHSEDLVIARTTDREAMLEVAEYLGCPARLIQRNENSDVDVTVIVGRPH